MVAQRRSPAEVPLEDPETSMNATRALLQATEDPENQKFTFKGNSEINLH